MKLITLLCLGSHHGPPIGKKAITQKKISPKPHIKQPCKFIVFVKDYHRKIFFFISDFFTYNALYTSGCLGGAIMAPPIKCSKNLRMTYKNTPTPINTCIVYVCMILGVIFWVYNVVYRGGHDAPTGNQRHIMN